MYKDSWTVSHLSESVEEGLGQSLTPPALSERILTAEDLCFLVLNLEAHPQFRDVDFCSVVKTSVQTLQHGLRGQVQLSAGETEGLESAH